jgi:hypothetical protein
MLYKEIEDIYGLVTSIRESLLEHNWSRRQTNYDAEFIAKTYQRLMTVSNRLYNWNHPKEKDGN